MSRTRGGPPARHVPTLTEVVEPRLPLPAVAAPSAPPAPSMPPLLREAAPVAVLAAAPALDEQALVEHILADLQRRIEPLIEQRLRETLAPTLALVAEMLEHDSRDQLTAVLRELTAQAVADALARQRRG